MINSRALTVSVAALLAVTVEAEPAGGIERYEVVHGWPRLPEGEILGQTTGVGIGRYVVADGGDQPDVPPDRSGVAVTDADGHVLERIGRFGNYDGQFRLAHDVALAADGSLYVVDTWGQRL